MKKITSLMVAAVCAFATPVAPPPAFAQALNAQEADIRAFIQDVARQTGRTFIVDPRVKGTVSVFSTGTLDENELFEVFLATLRANGLVAIPTANGAYRIAPEEGVAQQAGSPSREGFSTQVFRLRFIDASAAAETLKPLVGRQGQVIANRRSNTIVIADYADNVSRLRGLVAAMDQDRSASRTLSLRNSSAREMAAVARNLIGEEAAQIANGNAAGAVPPSLVLQIIPVDSSNSLILRGDADAVSRVSAVIEDLDQRAETQSDVRVIYLQHANAEQVLPVLREIVGQVNGDDAAAAAAAGGAVQQTAPRQRTATVSRFAGANALIISADPSTQRILGDVVRQLDRRRQQVLVEAIVVEVSDTAAKELGVQFLLSGQDGSTVPFAVTNYSDNAPSLLSLAGAGLTTNGSGEQVDRLRDVAINSLLGVNGALLGGVGEIGDEALFGFVINAVKRDTGSNLLSTPSVMTLDNEEATILVGQEVPVTTGEVLGQNNENPFRTVQRQDIGIQLDVKPQINAGGQITLALRQEVSSVAGPISASVNELVFNKREIETTVLVDDGEIIVLGGLLDDSERSSATRVPILGDIPVVGNLFRSRGRENAKTNLMVFIRPRIIRSPEEAREVSAPRLSEMSRAQSNASRSGASTLQAVVDRYLAEQKARGAAAAPAASAPPAP